MKGKIMDTAKVIKELRIARGLSQEELADLLFVSRELVSKWETRLRIPNPEMTESLSKLFNVPPDSIIDKDELIRSELDKCLPDECELAKNELVFLLNSFLSEQSIVDADMFTQRYYFHKSVSEIADIFNYKENHVRNRLHRIRKKLTKFITGRTKK